MEGKIIKAFEELCKEQGYTPEECLREVNLILELMNFGKLMKLVRHPLFRDKVNGSDPNMLAELLEHDQEAKNAYANGFDVMSLDFSGATLKERIESLITEAGLAEASDSIGSFTALCLAEKYRQLYANEAFACERTERKLADALN
ncbi:hypothetical protein IJ847_02765 [Candidatus Saccharibacteria bacterium]|nr:hypothetical protein [Candidatus Saccharibacteria bacterium]